MTTNILNMNVCPKCHGTGQKPIPPTYKGDKNHLYGYDEGTNTSYCDNCGLQYGMKPTGMVKVNRDGQPCLHSYTREIIGRCYEEFKCRYCADTYTVDSSD